jgi:hypothetical protein
VIRKTPFIRIVRQEFITERIMWVVVSFYNVLLAIFSIYAPTEELDKTDSYYVQSFRSTLSTQVEIVRRDHPDAYILLPGDYNGQIGPTSTSISSYVGSIQLAEETSPNGSHLISFCNKYHFAVANSFYSGQYGTHTWLHPNKTTANCIDHILVDDIQNVQACEVVDDLHELIPSDHRATIVSFLFPTSKSNNNEGNNYKDRQHHSSNQNKSEKINFGKWNDKTSAEMFALKVQELLPEDTLSKITNGTLEIDAVIENISAVLRVAGL